MAKRTVDERHRVWLTGYGPTELETGTPLQLQKDLILNITGPVTGNLYKFNGAGSIVLVDDKDAEKMLQKKSGHVCCSGTVSSPYFRLVE